jgi:hypothetical protein
VSLGNLRSLSELYLGANNFFGLITFIGTWRDLSPFYLCHIIN